MHRIDPDLLDRTVSVAVIGCGGTGSAVVAGLAYLHQALIAYGHPGGLDVTLYDGDVISPFNCVRQPFSRGEIGLNKATVLANRMNLFWGFSWSAVPENLNAPHHVDDTDIIIGCVDTAAARRTIASIATTGACSYWLDFGNSAEGGQFVLGQPRNHHNVDSARRLRTAAELWPEIVTPSKEEDDLPSCSAAEALTRQAPFVNQVLANHGLSLLARLFRYGQLAHHGGFVNLQTGLAVGIPVPHVDPLSIDDQRELRALQRTRMWDDDALLEIFDIDREDLAKILQKQRGLHAA